MKSPSITRTTFEKAALNDGRYFQLLGSAREFPETFLDYPNEFCCRRHECRTHLQSICIAEGHMKTGIGPSLSVLLELQ
jgi:hypothetical protein